MKLKIPDHYRQYTTTDDSSIESDRIQLRNRAKEEAPGFNEFGDIVVLYSKDWAPHERWRIQAVMSVTYTRKTEDGKTEAGIVAKGATPYECLDAFAKWYREDWKSKGLNLFSEFTRQSAGEVV